MRNCVCVAAGCVLLADTHEGIYLLSCVTVSLRCLCASRPPRSVVAALRREVWG